MTLQERINAFVKLGNFLSHFKKKGNENIHFDSKVSFYEIFNNLISNAFTHNPWFIENNIRLAIGAIADTLTLENLEKWLKHYPELKKELTNRKRVGVVMAGNIPLVGFHDMLSVLISGNIFIGKLSSKDNELLKTIGEFLKFIQPEFKNYIFLIEGLLKNFDAIITTGSNNTSRYFEYYFGKYPNIIRKNRNSGAILSGNETMNELRKLADDIFQYFGLGCRNVSKLFVPENYDFSIFFKAIEHYNFIYEHYKYANNYDYNKTIYLMNNIPFLDNGFVLLKEDHGFSSPIASLYYQYYSNKKSLAEHLESHKNKIQCIVTSDKYFHVTINWGKTQKPKLWDYADNIDTLKFLINLKN